MVTVDMRASKSDYRKGMEKKYNDHGECTPLLEQSTNDHHDYDDITVLFIVVSLVCLVLVNGRIFTTFLGHFSNSLALYEAKTTLFLMAGMGVSGEPFAYLKKKAIWNHFLRNFELELVSPFPEIDGNAMVVGVKGEIMVRHVQSHMQYGTTLENVVDSPQLTSL
ncbi:unnamed protein product [Ilex paraguariensis]|uniref:Uncharacterized protein n=1 Tax=Ilex paraguariensis TaxID=185542 RepID=A0ABC8U7S8_9AQUA